MTPASEPLTDEQLAEKLDRVIPGGGGWFNVAEVRDALRARASEPDSVVRRGDFAAFEKALEHHRALIEDAAEMRRSTRDDLAESIGRNRSQVDNHLDRLGRSIDTTARHVVALFVMCALLMAAVTVAIALAVAT